MAAAAYLHAIINNHAFHNGNKRTALVSTLVFLDLNGYVLVAEENELFDYLLKVADHKISKASSAERTDAEMNEIAQWIHSRSRPISREERVLKFHELRGILTKYDCVLEQPTRGNRINIRRGEYQTQVRYRNEGTDVERNTIKKIRKDLHLTEENGYDSTVFYNKEEKISGFIQKYRRTLDRLAKV